jgi:hypothetical protein
MGLCSTPGVPHKGWHLDDVIDLHLDEDLVFGEYEDCEFCDHEQIRYVHILSHKTFDRPMRVGCICSCKLTEDYVTPKERERKLRNAASRRVRFPNRKWRITKKGGETILIDGYRVTVGLIQSGKYRLWINSKEGSRSYDELRMAKIRAFDAVQEMKKRAENEKEETMRKASHDICSKTFNKR